MTGHIPTADLADRQNLRRQALKHWERAVQITKLGLRRSTILDALTWLILQIALLPLTFFRALGGGKHRKLNHRAVYVAEDVVPGGNYVVDAEGNRTPCSPAIRNVLAPEPVATKYNAATLRELFESSVAVHASLPAVHRRPFRRELDQEETYTGDDGKTATRVNKVVVMDNAFATSTYSQLFSEVVEVGAGLSHILETELHATITHETTGAGSPTVLDAPTPLAAAGSTGGAAASPLAASDAASPAAHTRSRKNAAGASAADVSGTGSKRRPPVRHVMIYAETKAEWIATAQACFRNNITVVTSYATLGPASLGYSFDLTNTRVVVTDEALLETLARVSTGVTVQDGDKSVEADLSHVAVVIYVPRFASGAPSAAAAAAIAALAARPADKGGPVKVISYAQLRGIGREHPSPATDAWRPAAGASGTTSAPATALAPGSHVRVPKPSSTAVIMFTSGTTGLPKGVQVTHANVLAGAAGIGGTIPGLGSTDVYIGFLPLAHILELAAETALLAFGASIGYGTVNTLTDAGRSIPKFTPGEHADIPNRIRGDAPLLRPTIMAGVPTMFERIRAGVTAKVAKASPIARRIFGLAFAARNAARKRGEATPLWNFLVFDKIRTEALGGRLRLMLSGGGPLEPATEEFFSTVFCCPITQGYGLTETCAAGTVNWPEDIRPGRVGPPVHCADIRLVDWTEAGYTHKDLHPRGEIYLGGPSISSGYFRNDAKTREAYLRDEKGRVWFATGDIGELHPGGVLAIIDRRKDLFKLSHGEYVSPSKIENALLTSPLIEHAMIYADSTKESCLAVIVPSAARIKQDFGDSKFPELKQAGLPTIAKHAGVLAAIEAEVARICKERKMARFEIPAKVLLAPEEWTPANYLTESMKLKRHVISKAFKHDLTALYAKVK